MVKRIWSLVTLLVLVLTECFTPMCCVLAENNAKPDFEVEENTIHEEEEESENQEEENMEDSSSNSEEEAQSDDNEKESLQESSDDILEWQEDTEDEEQDAQKSPDLQDSNIKTEGENEESPAGMEDNEDNEDNNIQNPSTQTTEIQTWSEANTGGDSSNQQENVQKNVEDNTQDSSAENPEIQTWSEVDTWVDTSNRQENWQENNQDNGENNTQNNEGQNTQNTLQTPEIQTWSEANTGSDSLNLQDKKDEEENEEWKVETITEEIQEIITNIRYFFKKEWDNRYIKYGRDSNNIWTITLKDPQSSASITIMDKNLWANSMGDNWYYFQWWNNSGVKTVNSSNKTTEKAVYKDSYYSRGYDGEWKFIIWGTDYWENGAHYNNLWWNESKESSRYGACPVGYHIPTVKEWNQLLSIWWKIHTQDTSTSEIVLRYSANYATKNIHTFKWAATQCSQWDTECVDEDKLSIIIDTLSDELKLPLAGSYDENWNFHDGLWVYWTSISKDGNKAWVFDMNTYIWNWTDSTLMYKSQWHNIRCFQNIYPYEAPAEIETQEEKKVEVWSGENPLDENSPDNKEGLQNEKQDSYSGGNIPSEFISHTLVLDTTKDFMNVELDANGWKFSDEQKSKTVKYGYYNEETTIDVEALKQDEYRSGYDIENEIEELQSIPVWYKLMDEIETPTREWYTFDGWYTELNWWENINFENLSVSEWMKVYAHWTAKEYTITRKNEDGTIKDTTKVAYGQIPTHENITQPSDSKYTYTFKWWEPKIKEVTWDAEYRATYTYTLRKYTVTWEDENGKVLKMQQIEYGTMPTYNGEIPTKESTEDFEYTFAWWDKEISEVKGNTTYKAKYDTKEIVKENQPILSQDDENNWSWTTEGWSEWSNVWDGWWSTQDSLNDSKWQTWDIESGSALNLLEELLDDQTETWEVLEYTDEDRELELAQIRSKLNKKKIKWKETYNNITVNVEAPKNSFPEWVKLRISPITWDTENQSIKDQLMENTDVTEDSELVSFDISFIYTLSNEEEVELQPKDWNTVKVSFNYKNNNKFNKGKKDKNKDLKIYHFEKVKDKKNRKSEETQIKEIKINESESTESEIVIDADSFSVYSVALVDWLWEEQDNFDVPMLKAISNTSVDPGWNRDNSKGTVTITLNANDGSFSNSSSTKNLDYGYYTRTETKYAHTSNYNDNWTSNWNCSSSDEKTTTVEITWATKLDIEVSYWLDRTLLWSDSLRILADWIDRSFSNSTSSWKWSTNWNSVSFTLNLAGRLWSSNPKWYYATIVWTIPVWWRTQDNVEEPTREWYEFSGWYMDTGYTTEFDDENYDFDNGSRTIYAKWTCASWYTEVWWECKQDCSVPASLWWGTIHHGQSVTWYQSASVPYGQTCQSEARICNNGTLEWSYTYPSCQTEQPTWCTLPWWWTTWNGAIVTAYTTASATCPTACTSATATCNNGEWSVQNFTWTYTNQTCTTNPSTCDASFILNSTGANWTYSGCTTYTVNGNSCNPWATKYKLTNCANGYHTENNSTCVSNSKQVACAQNGKPANSSYITWNVTVTWQWTWNSGNWSATGSCAWICDPHYHTWANGSSCEIDTFQITWKDGNGSTLKTDTVNYNETPVYAWTTPTKTATAQYSYTFNNTWSPTIVPATADATYTAQFNSVVNEYTITWNYRDANGEQIQSTNTVAYGQTPSAPSLPATSQSQSTVYTFTSWSPAVHSVDGTETYTAQYSESPRQYTITWKNDDWTTIDTTTVNYGATPTHADATKANTAQYTYTFVWWTPSIKAVTWDMTYTAQFNSIVNEYTATITATPNGYGSVSLASVKKDYNSDIVVNENKITIGWTEVTATPTPSDAQYTYTFSGWTNTCGSNGTKLTWDCTVQAQFERITNEYSIVFKNWDWAVLQSWMVAYGTTLTPPANPTKAEDAQYTYTFDKWSPSISSVTQSQVYTAVYYSTINNYVVNVVSNNTNSGTVTTWSITVPYGAGISTDSNILTVGTQTSTANPNEWTQVYAFLFNDWDTSDCGATVTTWCTVTANFSSNLRTYTIQIFPNNSEYWKVNDSIVSSTSTRYWSPIVVNDSNWTVTVNSSVVTRATPTPSDDQYTYRFVGWDSDCGDELTHNCTITGNFTRTVNEYDVIFDSNGWTPTPATQSVEYGSKAIKPADPIKTGYTFGWWTLNWLDFDFSTPIMWTTNLVAKRNLVEYTITYNMNWWTNNPNNPATYTIESWTITLESPTRIWYTFLWWTWSNGNVAQTWVTIPSWSDWNKVYNAVWQANTTEYTVYHYVKKVWENSYALSKTDILSGTTDEILILSSLAKESEFICAHYSSWSLTWTENWPWEIITQTNLKWDGTTKIYLYYTRNSYTVTLSGDEHIQMLKINWSETNQATLECGSNVPVEAVPKPWYHIVRWDREAKEEKENSDEGPP